MRRGVLIAVPAAIALIAGCGSSSSHSKAASTPAAKSTSTTASTPSTASTATTGTGAASPDAGKPGFEKVPIEGGQPIAPASTTGTGLVDHLIPCAPIEQLAYHRHAHLSVYVNGQQRAIPGGIGIPGSQVQSTTEGPVAIGGSCIYWLHTHAPDGVIHIESPTFRTYTLGQFFDEWHQPLTASQVGTVTGHATWYVDGKVWTKSPRLIPLKPYADIQADVGQPAVPFQKTNWSITQL